jgi:hypothetical protein
VYDPQTGVFRWREPPHWRVSRGALAGYYKNNRYLCIVVDGRSYVAQRLAWLYIYGEWPNGLVDHINCDRGDNRIANLRIADRVQNQANRGRPRTNRTGYKGVRRESANSWSAKIRRNGEERWLGTFQSPEAAGRAYALAAVEVDGEFVHQETVALAAEAA